MATNPLGMESVPTNPLNIFASFDRATIASAVEVLVCVLDTLDGDSDNEPGGDDEPLSANGDSTDVAWIEWDAMAPALKGVHNVTGVPDEDAEEDDPAGQHDEDGINTMAGWPCSRLDGPGCPISDPGGYDDGF